MNQIRTRLAPTPLLPQGWVHPRLFLHRSWYARRSWQWRARVALALLALLLIAVLALNLSPWWLLLAVLPALLPTPIRPSSTLRELEHVNGAYPAALIAPEDEFGFKQRLERQALTTQLQADPPAWPWLELGAMAVLCSLLLVIPPKSLGAQGAQRDVNREQLEQNGGVLPDLNSTDAPPVLDAPSRNAAPGGSDAQPGQAASGGAPGESQVGDLKPGGGRASDDPQAISKEFMDALERGSVRQSDPNGQAGQSGTRVEDRNNPGLAQQGSAGGDQNGSDPGGQNGKRGQSSNGQQGKKPGQSGQPGKNPGTQNGSNAGNSGQNGSSDSQSPQGNQSPNGSSNSSQRGGTGNGRGNSNLAEDPSEQFNPGRNSTPTQRSQPGKGGRGSSDPTEVGRVNGKGKLEYLPGTVQGPNVRSGALQLPGDPRQPLTGTPGTPSYRRAAESAILDPKLPPEYQELLKNYYK